jgi:PTS hybrid protein
MTGLVLISHSEMLVAGLRAMAREVAGSDVPIAIAGGTPDGRLGTSAPRIEEALRSALAAADEVLVLLDLGSAVLSLDVALDLLDQPDRDRVRVSDAPLVEGTIAAAVQASVDAPIDEVAAAAIAAAGLPKHAPSAR